MTRPFQLAPASRNERTLAPWRLACLALVAPLAAPAATLNPSLTDTPWFARSAGDVEHQTRLAVVAVATEP